MEQLKKAVRKSVTGRKMSDQFYVDGDVNVPDDKGDVGRIVYSQGMLRVEDMKQSGSYVRVSGRIQYQILYLAGGDDGSISVLQGKLPFEEMVYAEEEVPGMLWMKESSVELTVTIVHARKLRLRAMAELEIISQGEEEQYLTLDVEEEEGLCRRWENVEILTLHKSCRESFRIKEKCALPKQSDPVGKVLFTDITQKRTEIRLISDALQMRGELSIFVLYESTEGKLGWTEQAVPYEGKIDCYGADETMYYQAEPKIVDAMVDVKLDEDGELRIFEIEAVMEVCAVVYGEEQADVLEDMYSLKEQVTLEKEEIELSELVMQKASRFRSLMTRCCRSVIHPEKSESSTRRSWQMGLCAKGFCRSVSCTFGQMMQSHLKSGRVWCHLPMWQNAEVQRREWNMSSRALADSRWSVCWEMVRLRSKPCWSFRFF